MKYKITSIDVPADEPLRYDALNRGPSVNALKNLINNLSGPFVLAIDSPWGTGKTTFVRMLKSTLQSEGYKCLYFDAWKNDFTADPILGFLAEFDNLGGEEAGYRTHINKLKKIASAIAKRAIPAGGKILTAGLLDLDKFTEDIIAEYAAGSVSDAVDIYKAEQNLLRDFHESLEAAINELSTKDGPSQLIMFIDELDRCRPDFAIELLERVKHVFDVKNVVFVLSVDKSQLNISLQAIYGAGLNSDEYLRRFIDLEFDLGPVDAGAFTDNLFERFDLSSVFQKRDGRAVVNDVEHIKRIFNSLATLYELSLRAREQCFTRIAVAMMTTPSNYIIYPILLTTLAVLRIAKPVVYRGFVFGETTSDDVLESIYDVQGGKEFVESREGQLVEVFLIAAKHEAYGTSEILNRYKAEITEFEAREEVEVPDNIKRYKYIVGIINHLEDSDELPPLKYVVKKLELAAQFND